MGTKTDTLRMLREINRLLTLLIDAYLETAESARQISCWWELLRRKVLVR
jgi:hypothetical protein